MARRALGHHLCPSLEDRGAAGRFRRPVLARNEPLEWNLGPDHIASVSCETRGKIGWHSDAAWLASLQPEATLVVHNPNPPLTSNCVDDG